MVTIKELLELEDLNEVWEKSNDEPVLLFKQSTTCPISAGAYEQFMRFLRENNEEIAAYFVKVKESRQVSDQIAEDLGIEHQSPQIFLVKNKEAKWNVSHSNITVENIKKALASA